MSPGDIFRSRLFRLMVPTAAAAVACLLLAAGGCGRSTPERAVYDFLGAVQAHDLEGMRSCVNPEAVRKAEEAEGFLREEWENLKRRFVKDSGWRFRFKGVELETKALPPGRVLVTITKGTCEYYRLMNDRWMLEGDIDFSREGFLPLLLVEKEGRWYLEALDLYVLYAMEAAARR